MNEIDKTSYYIQKRQVSFSDMDAAGIVHFSRYLQYVEDAEHECLRHLGLPVFNGEICWPRVRVEIDYKFPLRLGEVSVGVKVSHLGNTSLVWEFAIWQNNQLCALGNYVVVKLTPDGKKCQLSANEKECLNYGFSKLLKTGK